jgi:integrase
MKKDISTSVYKDEKLGRWIARIDWYDHSGKRDTRRHRVESQAEGKRLARQWENEIREQGLSYFESDQMTFADLAKQYEAARLQPAIYRDSKKVSGLRDYKGQRNRLRQLVEVFGQRIAREITTADIERYKRERLNEPTERRKGERSLADVNRNLSLLKTVFSFGIESGWLARNPVAKRGLIAASQEVVRERALSLDEQRRLLEACSAEERAHIYPLVLCALDSGARKRELLTLEWTNVDLRQGTITVTAENAKTNKQRVIDLEPATMSELRRLKANSGSDTVFGIKNFRHAWESALKAASIEDARFHDLRATAITSWILRGMGTEMAMQKSGHTEFKTFMRYVRLSDEMRAKTREKLTEWELASALPAWETEPERPELIN